MAAPLLLYYFSAIGMASSLAIAGAVVVAYMLREIYTFQ
jgi:putative flippase GtrA